MAFTALYGRIFCFVHCRLLDMGFERDVKQILSTVKEKSAPNHVIQTVLLSATLSQREWVTWSGLCFCHVPYTWYYSVVIVFHLVVGVETLAGLSLKDPIRIHVNESETTETQAHDVSKAVSTLYAFQQSISLEHWVCYAPAYGTLTKTHHVMLLHKEHWLKLTMLCSCIILSSKSTF